ncbi:g11014 [Coccomyxa elongata]
MDSKRGQTVAALAEAFFPALEEDARLAHRAGKDNLAEFLSTSGGSLKFVVSEVLHGMTLLTPESRQELALLFALLQTGAGTAAVGGPKMLIPRCPCMQPFAKLSLQQREGILQYWASSPIPLLKKAFKGLKSIIASTIFNASDEKGRNPLWPAILYAGGDPERPLVPLPVRRSAEAALADAILDLADVACKSADDLRQLIAAHGSEVTCSADGTLEVVCDAVVVGSGAGGGVTAALLAQAGAKVIVLEKGGFTPAADLSLNERQSFRDMYEMGSFLTTQDAGVNILAGATLGGGTRVNWQASFETPAHVRREWAEEHGLPALQSQRYDRALRAVCTRLGVTTGIKQHSRPNEKLKAGLEAMGVHCAEIPRNCSREHGCGHCCFGCPSGDKQDATGTYLADAARSGAKIFTGIFAEKVLMSKAKGDKLRRQSATGIAARTTSPSPGGRQWRIVFKAQYIVSSAGALHTPALLLRSKIRVNGNVGKNLRLHPATAVIGVFSKGSEGERDPNAGPKVYRHNDVPPLPGVDKNSEGMLDLPEEILTWKGSIFSVFSNTVADWHGSGYGPLLQTPSAHPGLMAASIPWLSGLDYKRLCAWFPYVSIVLVLTRDRGCGRVTIGRDGLPRMHYWPDAHDRASMMKGMEAGLRAMAAGGSLMVGTLQGGSREATRFEPDRNAAGTITDPAAFDAFLGRVRAGGIRKNGTTVFSAHQMGTARMGASAKTSVVDARGECWHVSNLYVADASLFPTSTGVNPMITVEAMAYMVAEGLAEDFRQRRGQVAAPMDPVLAAVRPEE